MEVGPNVDPEIIMFPGLNTCPAIQNGRSKALGSYLSGENGVPLKLQGVNNQRPGRMHAQPGTLSLFRTEIRRKIVRLHHELCWSPTRFLSVDHDVKKKPSSDPF